MKNRKKHIQYHIRYLYFDVQITQSYYNNYTNWYLNVDAYNFATGLKVIDEIDDRQEPKQHVMSSFIGGQVYP